MSFKARPDAATRVESAKRLIRGLLALRSEVHEAQLRELLSICIWKLTEAEGPTKYKTRYQSVAAMEAPIRQLQHEHVYQRRD